MDSRKVSLLKKMQEKLKEIEIESVYRDGKKDNLPVDILTTVVGEFGADLSEVLAEFFFMPGQEDTEEEGYFFQTVLTLSEEATENVLPGLYEAVNVVNYYSPTGAFTVDKAGEMLLFRNSATIPVHLSDDEILDIMFSNINVSLNVAETYIDILFSIMENRMDMDELYGLFPGMEQESEQE